MQRDPAGPRGGCASEHTGPWGDTGICVCCAWLGTDEHGQPREGDGHPKEDSPRVVPRCWHPVGLALGRVILASHGSAFSITGAAREQPAVLGFCFRTALLSGSHQ